MSWEQFRDDAKRLVNRAASSINRTEDIATLQVKLASAEHRLSVTYEELGEVAYAHFTSEATDTTPVMKAIGKVDGAKSEVDALRTAIEEKKAANAKESKKDSADA